MSNVFVFDATTGRPPRELLQWCAERWGEDITAFNVYDARAIGLFDDEYKPICVVVCDNWKDCHTCTCSIGSDLSKRAGSRAFLRKVYGTIFDVWGVNRMHMYVEASNEDAINMHKHLGHVQEGIARDLYGYERDGILFGFTSRDWVASKWHPNKKREQGDNNNGWIESTG